jgi:hypothetical protein
MNPLAAEYNADSIRILQPDEATQRFEWLRIQELAHEYNRSPKWIARGFEACWRAGVEKDYFIERYLNKNKDIPFNEVVNEAFMELLQEIEL